MSDTRTPQIRVSTLLRLLACAYDHEERMAEDIDRLGEERDEQWLRASQAETELEELRGQLDRVRTEAAPPTYWLQIDEPIGELDEFFSKPLGNECA